MEAKKNLCGMIPENLHAKAIEEKEQLGLKTLGDYVELVLKERFEGGKITMAATKTIQIKNNQEHQRQDYKIQTHTLTPNYY